MDVIVFGFGILAGIIVFMINEILRLRKEMKESKEIFEEYERLFRSELKSLRNKIHS